MKLESLEQRYTVWPDGTVEFSSLASRDLCAMALPALVDEVRRMHHTLDAVTRERDEALNQRWDNSVAPGGYVCATCGVPVESERCRQHSPLRRGLAEPDEITADVWELSKTLAEADNHNMADDGYAAQARAVLRHLGFAYRDGGGNRP